MAWSFPLPERVALANRLWPGTTEETRSAGPSAEIPPVLVVHEIYRLDGDRMPNARACRNQIVSGDARERGPSRRDPGPNRTRRVRRVRYASNARSRARPEARRDGSTGRPAICAPANSCSATRSWRAPSDISGSWRTSWSSPSRLTSDASTAAPRGRGHPETGLSGKAGLQTAILTSVNDRRTRASTASSSVSTSHHVLSIARTISQGSLSPFSKAVNSPQMICVV